VKYGEVEVGLQLHAFLNLIAHAGEWFSFLPGPTYASGKVHYIIAPCQHSLAYHPTLQNFARVLAWRLQHRPQTKIKR